jgi:outer membrane protein TolC
MDSHGETKMHWNRRKYKTTWVIGLFSLAVIAGCASSREQLARDRWEQEAVVMTETPAIVSTDSVPDGAGLEEYIDSALRNNPGLAGTRQMWKAALERAPQAGSLPDPILSYGYFIEEVETRVGPQKQRLGVNQSIPWFGTLGLREEVALAGAEVAYRRYSESVENLVRDLKFAYADFYELAAEIEITRSNFELLRFWERVLNKRYSTGAAHYSDLIQVQVELGRLEDRLMSLHDRRAPRMARLNALMDLPIETILPWPRGLPVDPDLPDQLRLVETVTERNPELRALHATVDKEDRAVDLARKASYPNFTLGLDWVQTDPRDLAGLVDDGKDPILAKLSIQLPLWRGKVKAGIREAQARRTAASAKLNDRINAATTKLTDLLYRHADAQRKISLYGEALIPKGKQSLDAAYSAFESGKVDFLKVLDAQRVLLEFELSLEKARADGLRARAAIDALVGAISESGEPMDEIDRGE